MTPAEAMLLQVSEGQKMLELVMSDVTPEMGVWQPPGNANPIGVIFAHAIGLEDLYIHQIIQSKPLLWESGQWATKLGHATPPNQWNMTKTLPPDMGALLAYKQAVFAASQAYTRGLSAEDLDRALTFPGRAWSMSVAQLLAVVIVHTTSHAGEIAMLKGIQGGKGLPY